MSRQRWIFSLALAWAVLSTILAFLLGYLSYRSTRETLVRNFNTQQLLLAQQAAAEVERSVERLRHNLMLVSGRDYKGREEALNRFQEFFTEGKTEIAALFWLAADGSVRLALAPGGETELAKELAEVHADEKLGRFLRQDNASRHPESLISNAVPRRLHLAAHLSAMYPEIRGTLVVSVNVASLLGRFIDPLHPTAKGYAWVLASGGEILFHDTIPALVGKNAVVESRGPGNEDLGEIVEKMLQRETGTGEYRYRGVRKYVAFVPIALLDDFLSLAVCSPIEELTAVTRIGFTTTVFLILQLVSAFVLVLYLTFAGRREALQRSRDFAALWSLAGLRTRKIPLEELLRASLEEARSASGAGAGWIYLADYETGELKMMASSGQAGDAAAPPEKELIDQVFHGESVIPPAHPRFAVLPLPGRDKPLGVLTFSFTGQSDISSGRKEFLDLLAAEIGTSLENLLMVEELQSTSIQLTRANEVKSGFIGMVSHELKTPIAILKGYISLLREEVIPSGGRDMIATLDVMARKAAHLDRMVSDLLDLSRMEASMIRLERSTFEIRGFLEEFLRGLQPLLQECRITVSMHLADELPTLFADRERLGQVFSNLVMNSTKFTEPGGRIEIAATVDEKFVEFQVRDSGRGIPETDLEKIFARFYQVRSPSGRKHSGVGLGLAIVRQIVELHGGKIRCGSRLGEGATFIFTIPRPPASV